MFQTFRSPQPQQQQQIHNMKRLSVVKLSQRSKVPLLWISLTKNRMLWSKPTLIYWFRTSSVSLWTIWVNPGQHWWIQDLGDVVKIVCQSRPIQIDISRSQVIFLPILADPCRLCSIRACLSPSGFCWFSIHINNIAHNVLPAETVTSTITTTTYNIEVRTGDKSGAGTDANVFIILFGDKCTSGKIVHHCWCHLVIFFCKEMNYLKFT